MAVNFSRYSPENERIKKENKSDDEARRLLGTHITDNYTSGDDVFAPRNEMVHSTDGRLSGKKKNDQFAAFSVAFSPIGASRRFSGDAITNSRCAPPHKNLNRSIKELPADEYNGVHSLPPARDPSSFL